MANALYHFLLPVLAGLTLLMVICRLLMLWQKERTHRAGWYMGIYFSLFVLVLFRSLNLSAGWIAGAYLLLAVALAVCDFYEWRDFFMFIRRKDEAPVAVTSTLKELAEKADVAPEATTPVALEATSKDGSNFKVEGEKEDAVT